MPIEENERWDSVEMKEDGKRSNKVQEDRRQTLNQNLEKVQGVIKCPFA